MAALKYKMNTEYALVQAFYWMGYCTCLSFAAVYLQAKGLTNFAIGIVIGAGNVAGFFAAPPLAAHIDRTGGTSLYRSLWMLLGVQGLLALSFLLPLNKTLLCVLYGLYIACNAAAAPLNNQLSFDISGWSCPLNYGAARSIGSLGFAVMAATLGWGVKILGTSLLPYVGALIVVIQCAMLLTLEIQRSHSPKSAADSSDIRKFSKSTLDFIRSNGRFSILLLGILLLFFSQNLVSNFLINVVRNVGGDTASMGGLHGFPALMELPVMLQYAWISKKFPYSKLMRFSTMMFAVKAVCIACSNSVGGLYASYILEAGSYAILIPALVEYTCFVIPPQDSAKGQALSYGVITLGSAAAGGIGGLLYDNLSVRATLFVGAAVCIIGAIICKLGVVDTKADVAADSI